MNGTRLAIDQNVIASFDQVQYTITATDKWNAKGATYD